MAKKLAKDLAESWGKGQVLSQTAMDTVPAETDFPVEEAAADSEDSQFAKVLERVARYVIVELPGGIFRLRRAGSSGCWMGKRREFKNSRDFVELPPKASYTHVCKLCWPKGRGDSDSEASEASPAQSGDDEALEVPASQPTESWTLAEWPQEGVAGAFQEADE